MLRARSRPEKLTPSEHLLGEADPRLGEAALRGKGRVKFTRLHAANKATIFSARLGVETEVKLGWSSGSMQVPNHKDA